MDEVNNRAEDSGWAHQALKDKNLVTIADGTLPIVNCRFMLQREEKILIMYTLHVRIYFLPRSCPHCSRQIIKLTAHLLRTMRLVS